jgi:hypothetical protein
MASRRVPAKRPACPESRARILLKVTDVTGFAIPEINL